VKLPSWALDLVTTRDGVSWDPIRLLLILFGVTMIGLAGWDVVANKTPFNVLEFGSGAAALMAGAGIGVGAKRKDEPDAE
jgi:hypothetical protein